MEWFDICDENGVPTGETVSREQAHREGILHRTAHVWVIRTVNGRCQVLLQKRSQEKDSFPGLYDTSSAGHIPAGCEPLESALRELEEELGIRAEAAQLHYADRFRIRYEKEFHGKLFRDNEVSEVYVYEEPVDISGLRLQESEVEEVRWFDLGEVRAEILVSRDRFCIPTGGLEALIRYLERKGFPQKDCFPDRDGFPLKDCIPERDGFPGGKGFPERDEAEALLREGELLNPGPWGNHSRITAQCAERIAARSGMDPEKAYVLGLLHDIGRRFGKRHLRHVSDGYSYMMSLGYEDAARICLTHSFNAKKIEGYVGNFDTSEEETEMIRSRLRECVFDDYDRLIQLCDAVAGSEGVMDIIDRMNDVKRRYGFYDPEKWDSNLRLRAYFEEKMGMDLYDAVNKEPPVI